jgi:VWFA-related protein
MHRALGVCAVVLSLPCWPGFAQQPGLAPRPGPPAVNAADRAIQLDVVVNDKSGKPVSGLGLPDFTLLDNGQPAKIVAFHAYDPGVQLAPPVEVIILFDTINQGFDAVSYARIQVMKFLRQNGGHLAQPVSLSWLTNEKVEGQGEPSTDGNALAAQLETSESRLRSINRSAGANGAIELFEYSLSMLEAVAEREAQKPGRKLIIWAGPGWPMLDAPGISFTSAAEQKMFSQIVALSTKLREGHITVYSISQGLSGINTFLYESFLKGVKKANQAVPPDLALKVLAVQSGGLVVPPSNDLVNSLNICAQDGGPFYSLTFEPVPADGPNQYHELKIRMDKPGLTARTNTGYYDQPGEPAAP